LRTAREIIREHEFEEPLERLLVNMEEADDFTLGAEFVLARDPLSGTPVNVGWLNLDAADVSGARAASDAVLRLR
jgi:hypothetical protein